MIEKKIIEESQMEVVTDENVKGIIREELDKLGISASPPTSEPLKKPNNYGSKLFNKNSQNSSTQKYNKHKKKDNALNSTPIKPENKKNLSKSPFTSSKNRSSYKKKHNSKQSAKAQVFGQPLTECCKTPVTLADSITITAPSFLIDACNLLRRNITLEGLFRKAGSSSRQNDIKRIIDSGGSLPSNIHPIDAACLVKQFFRCLPEPLLEPAVHSRMLSYQMNVLDENARHSALILCTLLLSAANQHVLIYFLNFLHEVVNHCNENRMDAHNLAVVLSPNILPLSVPGEASFQADKKSKNTSPLLINEDGVLSANIDIMEVLINYHDRVCRLPSEVISELKSERSLLNMTTEDAVDSIPATPSHTNKNKKRRSASVHWLVSGIRRVVGAPTTTQLPPANSPHPNSHHRIIRPPSPLSRRSPAAALLMKSPLTPALTLSLHPEGFKSPSIAPNSPTKRKSDALEGDDKPSSDISNHPVEGPPKKAKVSTQPNSSSVATKSYAAVAALAPKPSPVNQQNFKTKVRRVQSARKASSKQKTSSSSSVLFPRHLSLATFLDQAPVKTKKRKSPRQSGNSNLTGKLSAFGDKWNSKYETVLKAGAGKSNKPTFVAYPYLSADLVKSNKNISVGQNSPLKHCLSEWSVSTKETELIPLQKSQSQVIGKLADFPSTPLKSSLTDPDIRSPAIARADTGRASLLSATPVDKMNTPLISALLTLPSSGNSLGSSTPRGGSSRASKRQRRKTRLNAARQSSTKLTLTESETPICEKRGVPDGAEEHISTPVLPKKCSADPLNSLEEQYMTIKSAVKDMEIDMGFDIDESLPFKDNVESVVTLNHNEIIQSAYDRIQKESNGLGMSPSEHLSRRLDKELKIRRRRSGEGRVCRSPSERRIGTIRRRSKELEVKQQQSEKKSSREDNKVKPMTPIIKPSLVKSPLTQSLKRGRPNAVRCGLPQVVVSCNKRTPVSVSRATVNALVDIPSFNLEDSLSSSTPQICSRISYSDACKQSSSCVLSPGGATEEMACDNLNLGLENEEWQSATDFFENQEEPVIASDSSTGEIRKEKDGNRPSIAALKKQKKVTANVQLFNQLGTNTPQRRQSRAAMTPSNRIGIPIAASEQKMPPMTQRNRAAYRASLTPRQMTKKNSNNLLMCQPMTTLVSNSKSKVAIVTPLRENLINVCDSSFVTPQKPRESSMKFDDTVFKTPGALPPTPLRSKQNKNMKLTRMSIETSMKQSLKDTYI